MIQAAGKFVDRYLGMQISADKINQYLFPERKYVTFEYYLNNQYASYASTK